MADITQHEGKKYLKLVHRPPGAAVLWNPKAEGEDVNETVAAIGIDVYAVLVAWEVTCPARAHALKKILAAGSRGKGSVLDDLVGARAAIDRAIEIERIKAAGPPTKADGSAFDQLRKEQNRLRDRDVLTAYPDLLPQVVESCNLRHPLNAGENLWEVQQARETARAGLLLKKILGDGESPNPAAAKE